MKTTSPEAVKRIAKETGKAALEQKFLDAWVKDYGSLGMPLPTLQHQFHPTRKWKFDFAFVEQRLAIEIQGGAFVNGGHNRAPQQAKDYEKHNAAVSLGWRVLFFNTMQLKDIDSVVDFVAEVLSNAKELQPPTPQ